MQKFDFIVIGSGPAGQRAAIQAAKLGKQVAIIDRREMLGGVSVHTGTIPSKTLREAALYLSGWDQRGLYGQNYRLKSNLTIDDLKQRLYITLQHETEVIHNQLSRNHVQIINGTAVFQDEHTVVVTDGSNQQELYQADYFLIAVGSRPHHPEDIPFENDRVIDSDGILELGNMPASMLVVGAGVIGIEYASIFSTLDVKVTVIDGRDHILGFLDREIVDELTHSLRDRGVSLRLGENITHLDNSNNHVTLTTDTGKTIRSDLALFAAGRIGSGVMIVLSDFLFKEGYDSGLRRLIGRQYDLYAIQVLCPQELSPDLSGELKLIDIE